MDFIAHVAHSRVPGWSAIRLWFLRLLAKDVRVRSTFSESRNTFSGASEPHDIRLSAQKIVRKTATGEEGGTWCR